MGAAFAGFRSLLTWAAGERSRPRHRRRRRRAVVLDRTWPQSATAPTVGESVAAAVAVASAHAGAATSAAVATPTPPATSAPAPTGPARAPALQHLGVVGARGTVGAAVYLAASRAAAERRFHGGDPRARLIDPRPPAAQRAH